MKFDIISLFPELFGAFTDHSMIKRAISAGHIEVTVTNPRDFFTYISSCSFVIPR